MKFRFSELIAGISLSLLGSIGIPAVATAVDAPEDSHTATGNNVLLLEDGQAVDLEVDNTKPLINPGMGWIMYVEEFERAEGFADPSAYWNTVDPYKDSAAGVYLRIPWSRLEPTEGHYAWQDDQAYQAIINGAKERGIKLAFRIFIDSQDVHRQATPEFVFSAGARGYRHGNSPFKNPYIDDPVFRTKFENFLQAFAQEYDDAANVEFIDMNTIGFWGEMHNLRSRNGGVSQELWDNTIQWLDEAYNRAFQKVMLVMNYANSAHGYNAIDRVVENGAIIRRDGVGSTRWFSNIEKNKIKAVFPKRIFVAENCYQAFTVRATSCDNSFRPLRQMLERVVNQSLDLHANYIDLRKAVDVVTWVRDNKDLVDKFGIQGGYRIAPVEITKTVLEPADTDREETGNSNNHDALDSTSNSNQNAETTNFSITWKNFGVGRLPNNVSGWNGRFALKYRVVNASGEVVKTLDSSLDPGTFIKDSPKSETITLADKIPAGIYSLETAIVDTYTGDKPAVRLALAPLNPSSPAAWYALGSFQVERDEQIPANGVVVPELHNTTEISPAEPGINNQNGIDTVTKASKRISGADRVETSVAAWKEMGGSTMLVLASADSQIDALTSTPIAHVLNTGVVYTYSSSLPAQVREIIQTQKISEVMVIGGKKAVSPQVVSQLLNLGIVVTRIGGTDRYQTAINVAEKIREIHGVTQIPTVLATGNEFADSIVAGPVASKLSGVVLISDGKQIPEAINNWITLHTNQLVAVGGPARLAATSASMHKGMDFESLSGIDRYETAVKVQKSYFANSGQIALASGEVAADAVVAGVWASKHHTGVLLTRSSHMLDMVKNTIDGKEVVIFGGHSRVPDLR